MAVRIDLQDTLTEERILREHGDLIFRAFKAFLEDPTYVTDMLDAAVRGKIG